MQQALASVSHTSDSPQHKQQHIGEDMLDVVQGIEPEIRTYNTVIIACNMSGQAQEALKVYERMLTAGALPTATTYTALISAYGKNGQLDRALQIFEDMVSLWHLPCRRIPLASNLVSNFGASRI